MAAPPIPCAFVAAGRALRRRDQAPAPVHSSCTGTGTRRLHTALRRGRGLPWRMAGMAGTAAGHTTQHRQQRQRRRPARSHTPLCKPPAAAAAPWQAVPRPCTQQPAPPQPQLGTRCLARPTPALPPMNAPTPPARPRPWPARRQRSRTTIEDFACTYFPLHGLQLPKVRSCQACPPGHVFTSQGSDAPWEGAGLSTHAQRTATDPRSRARAVPPSQRASPLARPQLCCRAARQGTDERRHPVAACTLATPSPLTYDCDVLNSPSSPQDLFRFLDILVYVEATIYQVLTDAACPAGPRCPAWCV